MISMLIVGAVHRWGGSDTNSQVIHGNIVSKKSLINASAGGFTSADGILKRTILPARH
jgi:hypothetical protein